MDQLNLTHFEGAAHSAYLAQSRVPNIIACNVILLSIVSIAVAMRLYVRYRYFMIRSDDILCFISWNRQDVHVFSLFCLNVEYGSFSPISPGPNMYLVTRYGYGRHFELIAKQPSTVSMFLKLVFVTQLAYIIALNMIKMSFCVLYMHIFAPSRVLNSLCVALIILLIMECVEEIIVVILQCRPVQAAWTPIPAKCLNLTLFYYVSFGIKLATDIAIFVLPIPPLLRLRVRGLQKFVVILMFALGLMVCVTSIIRVTYIKDLNPDHTWSLVAPLNWSAVEICVAIFISCLPSLKTLITIHWQNASRVTSSNTDSTADSLCTRIRTFFLGNGKEADHEQRHTSPDGTAGADIPLRENNVRTVDSAHSNIGGEMPPQTITLESQALRVKVLIDNDGAAFLQQVLPLPGTSPNPVSKNFSDSYAPLVEVRLAGEGTERDKSSKSLVGSYVGSRLRYQSHEIEKGADTQTLHVRLQDGSSGALVTSHLTVYEGFPVLRATASIQNGGDKDFVVTQLTSLVLGGLSTGSERWWHEYRLSVPNNSWFREAQWVEHDLPSLGVDDCGVYGRPDEHWGSLTHYSVSNRGTFSTEGHLPMGLLKHVSGKDTWLWQVENNGSWRWEIGDWKDSIYLAAGGPVETEHDWRERLSPGQKFTTVPVALCHVQDDYEAAFAAMTRYRRQIRRKHRDHDRLPIIFNDYMNCLMGDPTEEKILALVDPVVNAGAGYFVIDAGWYADDSGWWDDVGLWEPSSKRFPSGFKALLSQIRNKGLIPGLWIEPEVIGVRSAVAKQLPNEAFFQRDGHRIVEKNRYQLDYRHPAVREHMSAVIHRLVTEYGVGYFKFDYNIDVTQGTDINCSSPGSGQLGHNRAYLQWVDELHDRYHDLVIENCSSGAQRMDYAMLAVHALQSSSDQQDPERYPAIASALPTAVTPEQGAIWAYPQPAWDGELNAMTVVNSLLGRVHLSGRLDLLRPEQIDLIKEGMDVYRAIRADLPTATAFWPLGLPQWHDDWFSLGMDVTKPEGNGRQCYYLSIWRRGGPESIDLPVKALCGRAVSTEILYPTSLPAKAVWLSNKGLLEVTIPSAMGARLIKLTAE
ncbi:hypothetical protein KXV36_007545 [Aspergillus fumigatus]|nr:hypothetical protein KXV21_001522 [Aspergillus fumigatus]KAH2576541.1 hypothetical protein KXV42_005550 [Aspergillus fumigatus]KAH2689117.1 hypothetical protein KXV96_004506 [Aspergillus fumigatus]KAH3090130.1 hypothetical protein KXV36_007545 [Aspergillus fumigatus]KAH3127300.1 hypothetical protein KXV82_004265 [Aspergillus fumigatus]